MMSRRHALQGAIVLAFGLGTGLRAQPVIGRFIECPDRQQFLVSAGRLTSQNPDGRSGPSGRVMLTLECDARGRDGIEAGYLSVAFVERRVPRTGALFQETASGSANTTKYFGFITERALPGLLENFHLSLGVGAYFATKRQMRETVFKDQQGQDQVNRYDYAYREKGVGASVGAAFLLGATRLGTAHLEIRQHWSGPSSDRLVWGIGILF